MQYLKSLTPLFLAINKKMIFDHQRNLKQAQQKTENWLLFFSKTQVFIKQDKAKGFSHICDLYFPPKFFHKVQLIQHIWFNHIIKRFTLWQYISLQPEKNLHGKFIYQVQLLINIQILLMYSL